MEIRISEIDWTKYPREEPNQKQIELYRLSLAQLPPIAVNKELVGIDGYHRCQAYRQEGKEVIPAIVEDIPDEEVLYEAIKRNSVHGLQLSLSDKRRNGAALYPQYSVDDIAELLGVSKRSVDGWTKAKREEERNEEDKIIWDMWLACKTQDEIAETVKQDRSSIAKRIVNLRKDAEIHIPDSLKVFNLWSFGKRDDRFGITYPGQIPGQIIENLLYYHTEPFDVVMDLFGGGGVTVDVCKHMARRYRVYDIEPVRDDIIKHDITNGIPNGTPKPDFIFLDPPYWSQKKGEYGEQETNLSNLGLDEFHNFLAELINECKKITTTALIIGSSQKEWEFLDHAAEIMIRCGAPYERIQVPYNTQQYGGNRVKAAKENKQWLNLNRDLMVYK